MTSESHLFQFCMQGDIIFFLRLFRVFFLQSPKLTSLISFLSHIWVPYVVFITIFKDLLQTQWSRCPFFFLCIVHLVEGNFKLFLFFFISFYFFVLFIWWKDVLILFDFRLVFILGFVPSICIFTLQFMIIGTSVSGLWLADGRTMMFLNVSFYLNCLYLLNVNCCLHSFSFAL